MTTAPQLPIDLDQKAWELWLQYRKAIKKPLHEFSWPLAQRKLARFGKTQLAVVEQSIENGWQGLFDLKDGGGLSVSVDVKAPW